MKRLFVLLIPALLIVTSAVTVAQGSATVGTAEDPNYGTYLTDANGIALYMFTRDLPNESTCYDQCAEAWPIFSVEGDLTLPEGVDGTLGTITRTDGTTQVTYNEMPLYYWAQDTQPGETLGQGVGSVWFIVAPGTGFADYGVVPMAATPEAGAAGTTVKIRRNQDLGDFLVDGAGMTLYMFAQDTTPGESACYDQCATNWPPLLATEPLTLVSGIPGELGTISRTDGTMQVTYDGMPLYYFAEDVEGGDTNGQGRGDNWFVVAVVPPAMATPAAEGTPTS